MAQASLGGLRGRPLRPVAVLCAALWIVEGCYSWSAQQGSARQIIADHRETALRLIRVGGERQEVSHAELIKDTVFGFDLQSRRDVRIPLDSVTGVEVSTIDGAKTVGLIVVLGATASSSTERRATRRRPRRRGAGCAGRPTASRAPWCIRGTA